MNCGETNPDSITKGKKVVVDILLFFVFVVFGGLVGLVVEVQKYLCPIYSAVILLLAVAVLDRLEKVIEPKAEI